MHSILLILFSSKEFMSFVKYCFGRKESFMSSSTFHGSGLKLRCFLRKLKSSHLNRMCLPGFPFLLMEALMNNCFSFHPPVPVSKMLPVVWAYLRYRSCSNQHPSVGANSYRKTLCYVNSVSLDLPLCGGWGEGETRTQSQLYMARQGQVY